MKNSILIHGVAFVLSVTFVVNSWNFQAGPYGCGGDYTCRNCSVSQAEKFCIETGECVAILYAPVSPPWYL